MNEENEGEREADGERKRRICAQSLSSNEHHEYIFHIRLDCPTHRNTHTQSHTHMRTTNITNEHINMFHIFLILIHANPWMRSIFPTARRKKNYKCDIIPLSLSPNQWIGCTPRVALSAQSRSATSAAFERQHKVDEADARMHESFAGRRNWRAWHIFSASAPRTHTMHTNELWLSNRKQFSIIAFQLLPINRLLQRVINVRRIVLREKSLHLLAAAV